MPSIQGWRAKVSTLSLVDGPNAVQSGTNPLANGSEQSFSGLNYALRFSMTNPPSQGRSSRREYGWLLSQSNGVNAVRYHYCDGQRMTMTEAGNTQEASWVVGGSWSDGRWQTGSSYGVVALSSASSQNTNIIRLDSANWGHRLGFGDAVGFSSAFGVYFVTEVLGNGAYRVVPPLRSDIQPNVNWAHLHPVIPVKISAGSVNYGVFNPAYASDRGAQFVEVFHSDATQLGYRP